MGPNSKNSRSFPAKDRNKVRMLISPLLFGMVLEILVKIIRQEDIIGSMRIQKKKVKLSLYADDLILYLDNTKESIEKLPQK